MFVFLRDNKSVGYLANNLFFLLVYLNLGGGCEGKKTTVTVLVFHLSTMDRSLYHVHSIYKHYELSELHPYCAQCPVLPRFNYFNDFRLHLLCLESMHKPSRCPPVLWCLCFKVHPYMICILRIFCIKSVGSKVAEWLGNRASNLKVASLIPGRVNWRCVLGQGTSSNLPRGMSLYLL